MNAADPPPAGLAACTVTACRDGTVVERPDLLAEEVPVAMVYNGITQVVMLATPADQDVSPNLQLELLATADLLTVTLQRAQVRELRAERRAER